LLRQVTTFVVDIIFVYDPFSETRAVMAFGLGGSWRALGLTGVARTNLIEKLERHCKKYW
jgi:hypothetical protein